MAAARTTTFLRPLLRRTTATTSNSAASSGRISHTTPNISVNPNNFTLRPTRISSPSLFPSRVVRRELITLQPMHSAVASACLVSKICTDAATPYEGRFANYLSPI